MSTKRSLTRRIEAQVRRSRQQLEEDKATGMTVDVYRTTHVGYDGRRRCREDGKVWHRDIPEAERVMRICLKEGYDPGLVVMWCETSHGYHLAHPHGWRSLDRAQEA